MKKSGRVIRIPHITIETFPCKVCGKTCQSYHEFLEEHLRKHK